MTNQANGLWVIKAGHQKKKHVVDYCSLMGVTSWALKNTYHYLIVFYWGNGERENALK